MTVKTSTQAAQAIKAAAPAPTQAPAPVQGAPAPVATPISLDEPTPAPTPTFQPPIQETQAVAIPKLELVQHLRRYVDGARRKMYEGGVVYSPESIEEAKYLLGKKDANGNTAFRIARPRRAVQQVQIEEAVEQYDDEGGDFIGGQPVSSGVTL